MPLVTITSRFKLLEQDGSYQDFYPGPQHISDEHANHWYVKLFLKSKEDKPPAMGTPEYGAYLREQHLAVLRELEADKEVLAAARAETVRLQEQEAVTQMNQGIQQNAKVALKRARIPLRRS